VSATEAGLERLPATKKIALIGSAPSSVGAAPYADRSWTIWGCSPGAAGKAPIDYKTILVEHYTKFGYVYEKAGRLSISRQTYYQRKASAERHVANAIGL
jgi:hypothetical protein